MPEPRTLVTRHVWQARSVATRNDGTSEADQLNILIMAETFPIDPDNEEQPHQPIELFQHWVDGVLDGRDLTHTLHFAPTARNLALYVDDVLASFDLHFETISVSIDGVSVEHVKHPAP